MTVGGNYWNKFTPTQIDQAIENALALSPGPAAASLIHQASVTLTNDDIVGLGSAGFVVTGNPAVTQAILVTDFISRFVFAADYTTAANGFGLGTALYGQLFVILFGLPAAVQTPYSALGVADWSGFASGLDLLGGLYGQGVVLFQPGLEAITDGDPANTWTLCISFKVFSATLGRYQTTAESGWDADTRTFS